VELLSPDVMTLTHSAMLKPAKFAALDSGTVEMKNPALLTNRDEDNSRPPLIRYRGART